MLRDTNPPTEGFVPREFDEPIFECLQRHRVVSNEASLYETFDYIRDETGAGLGVGLDQMLDIAVNSRLDEVYILDLLPDVTLTTKALLETGRKLHESLGRYPTVQEYLDCFGELNIVHTLDMLAAEFDERELSIIEGSLTERVRIDTKAPPEPDAPLQLKHYLSFKASQTNYRSWVSDDAALERVVSMYEQRNITPILGDLAGDHAMPGIAARLKDRNVPLSIIYLSNTDHYIGNSEHDGEETLRQFARNMDELPTTGSTILMRTKIGSGMPLPESVMRDPWMGHITQTWNYELQTVADWERERQGAFTYEMPNGQEFALQVPDDRVYAVTRYSANARALDVSQPKPGLILAGFSQRL